MVPPPGERGAAGGQGGAWLYSLGDVRRDISRRMIAFAAVIFATVAHATPRDWGDFPTPSRPTIVGGELVRLHRLDRAQFGRLPIRWSFASELAGSVEQISVGVEREAASAVETTGP